MARKIQVRQVWNYNLQHEFDLIRRALPRFPNVSIDTEFPGVIYHDPDLHYTSLSPNQAYALMKRNVDATKLIQLGLTLSDAKGNLPDFGTESCYVWEFNFREFDVDQDLQNPQSVSLLERQGIDFLTNKKMGVSNFNFARLFMTCGLPSRPMWGDQRRTWLTFHSMYDFGFLIKMLSRKQLPRDLSQFMAFVRMYFGVRVFDLKQMMGSCGLCGGLERMAKSLKVERMAGKSHQAGSDSLLIMQAFVELKKVYFNNQGLLDEFNYKIYGLVSDHVGLEITK